jgi:hypothetical protein
MMANLYKLNRSKSQWSTGGAYVHFLHDIGPYKLVTAVECEFTAINTKQIALLDTGAELSVMGAVAYELFLYKHLVLGASVGNTTINTRLGNFQGTLHRVEVSLTADWGQPLTIEGTFLFCEQWTGPTVLGFHGFLERVRFAIDPNYEQVGGIYFAEAS